jgi:preprotein translocase subunit SecB
MSEQNKYKLERVALLRSDFKREGTLEMDDRKFEAHHELKVLSGQVNPSTNKFTVGLELDYWQTVGGKEQVRAKIIFAGSFEKIGEPKPVIDFFKEVNAPAQIFPFVREHLATLSIKASLSPILLEPINFVDRHNSNKENKNE